jgi:hypothetical protein
VSAAVRQRVDVGAQIADRLRQLVAARRRLAEPERDGRRQRRARRRRARCRRDLQDPPRRVAQLEDVAGVDSIAKSSFSVPTNVSPGSRTTR